jgi:hypothetical protein
MMSRAAAGPPLEFVDDFAREAVRVEWKGPVQVDARHFPVAGGGVLTRRGQRATAVRALGTRGGGDAGERLDVAESQAGQVGQRQPSEACDISQRVGAGGIVESGGVGHGADPHAVQDDPDYPLEHRIRL